MRLATPLFLVLALGALAASAQTPKDGRHVLVDTTFRKFGLYRDALFTLHGMGGQFTIKDLVWRAGQASFCIEAHHSWGDYGWQDYGECVTGNIVKGQQILVQPQTDLFLWIGDSSRNVHAFTGNNDTLRALFTLHQDTVRLSFWWIHIRAMPNPDIFLPGNVEKKDVDTLTMRLARRYRINSTLTAESVTEQFHSMAFVPEESVGLDRFYPALRRPWRPMRGLPAVRHDLLGRSGPRAPAGPSPQW